MSTCMKMESYPVIDSNVIFEPYFSLRVVDENHSCYDHIWIFNVQHIYILSIRYAKEKSMPACFSLENHLEQANSLRFSLVDYYPMTTGTIPSGRRLLGKKEEEAQSRFSATRARMRILPKRSSRHHLHLQNLKNVKHLHHPPNSKPAHNFNNESSVN